MASYKRKRNLDQSTRDSLSALEKALEMATASPLRADEFTTEQYIEKLKKLGLYTTYDSSRWELKKLVKLGELKSRKIKLNGKQCNAYSDATGKA
jgi:hypothetical protein